MSQPQGDLAWRSARAWAVLAITFSLALALDLWSKDWAFKNVGLEPVRFSYREVAGHPEYQIPWHPGVEAIPGRILDFRLVLNHGAVFGLGQGRGPLFIGFTVLAVTAALYIFGRYTHRGTTLAHVGIGLVLAGGIGNMYDRVTVGAVRDFMNLFPRRTLPFDLHWPGGSNEWFPWVFNVADTELIAGMLMLMLAVHLAERRARKAKLGSEAAAPAQAAPPGQS